MATLPQGVSWNSTCKELYLPFFFQISEQPQEQGAIASHLPLEGMGDEVPRNRRQPDLGTRRQMGGRVASSTADSFTQMASKQRNSGLPWTTARWITTCPEGWGGGFGG